MGLLEKNTENFSVIPMSNNAFEKIKAYARLIGNYECYGFLLSSLERNDGIVDDSILASGQEVSGSHARISADSAINMKEEIKNIGYKPVGFWHSHANFSAFHSGTDDRNMDSLLLSFAVNTGEKELLEEKERNSYFVDDNSITVRYKGKEYIFRTENNDLSFKVEKHMQPYSDLILGMTKDSGLFLNTGRQTISLKQPANVEIKEYSGLIKNITGIGYSLVVNNSGEYFAEIGKSHLCNSCNRMETDVKVGKVKIVNDDKIQFTDKELIADLEKRIINADRLFRGGNALGKFKRQFG